MIDSTETATETIERKMTQLAQPVYHYDCCCCCYCTYKSIIEPHKRSMTTQWRPLWTTPESIWQHGKTKSMVHALEIRWMYWKRHDGPLTLACVRNCPPFGTFNRRIGFPFSKHCFINTLSLLFNYFYFFHTTLILTKHNLFFKMLLVGFVTIVTILGLYANWFVDFIYLVNFRFSLCFSHVSFHQRNRRFHRASINFSCTFLYKFHAKHLLSIIIGWKSMEVMMISNRPIHHYWTLNEAAWFAFISHARVANFISNFFSFSSSFCFFNVNLFLWVSIYNQLQIQLISIFGWKNRFVYLCTYINICCVWMYVLYLKILSITLIY